MIANKLRSIDNVELPGAEVLLLGGVGAGAGGGD